MLSTPSSVCSRGCMRGDLRRNCATCAASSSTLMEMSPWGLSHVRTRARISGGSAHCQTWAVPCRSKKTPPSAYVQASDAPNHVGALGNSSRRCVGRACIVWKKCRQRRSVTAAPREMRTRPPGRGVRFCSTDRRPRPPGTPGPRLRRVPSSWSHVLPVVRRRAQRESSNCVTRLRRLGVMHR